MVITKFLFTVEIVEKLFHNNVFKYIIYDKHSDSWYKAILVCYYKGKLRHIKSTFYHVESLRSKSRQVIGYCWKSVQKLGCMYPRLLVCYWSNYNMVIPITDKIALSYNTNDIRFMQTRSPLLQMNRIKNYSIELPITISIDVLQILIETERRKLNMCAIKPKTATQTLDGAIDLLGQCNVTNSSPCTFMKQLTKGIHASDYHSSVITICEHILEKLKVKKC